MSRVVAKGPQDLKKEVLDNESCSACGACISLCPYIDLVAGKAVIIEPCGLSEGRCYSFCPRTYLNVSLPNNDLLVLPAGGQALGSHLRIVKARSMDAEIKSAAQYGGVTSALMTYALETGEIDVAALARSWVGRTTPKPTLAKNREEVLQCAGSKYIVCPVLTEVTEAVKSGIGIIGVVGTPCQVTAIRKMQALESEPAMDRIRIVIGLFCTWALSPEAYNYIRNLTDPSKVVKLDVPPPPANILVIETEEERIEIPLDDIGQFIMPACNVCLDMTSEFADISIGTVEGEADWNTVIVRTRFGDEFLQRAREAGIVETRPLEKERVKHLCTASSNKKKRALIEMESRKIYPLGVGDEDRSRILL